MPPTCKTRGAPPAAARARCLRSSRPASRSLGEGGPFAASGVLGPEGKLKVNTGGGQLSAYYMWGMTPLSEAVIQARGQAGERQVPDHELVLVSGNGGVLDHHSTLVLATAP